jgi:hypothetical protein
VQGAPSATVVVVAVGTVVTVVLGGREVDVEDNTPSQDPETQVLNAQSESEVQVAPVFPQTVTRPEFTA